LENEMVKKDEIIAKMKDEMVSKFATLEDDIEDRVSKLEDLSKTGTLRTCSEYAKFGLATSGNFLIDPDGPLMGHEPFMVFCNFTEGTTELYHNTESLTEVEHCHDPGCYNKTITYVDGAISNDVTEIPMGQIVSLINLSASCTQSFAFDCTLAPFIVGDVMYHYWEDRNGDTFNYYTGSHNGNHSCDCHFTEDGCAEEAIQSNTCNCDANLPVELQDTGVITNITALPITKLFFGGLSYEIQYGAFQLGRLKCYGEADINTASSCTALKKSGVFTSGHYVIKEEGDSQQKIVYCGMNSSSYDEVSQSDDLSLAPIGTILPYLNKLDPSSGDLLPLPNGWQMCDGSNITKGPWLGSQTPDLNGQGLFLRGGDQDSMLEVEQSMLQDHEHEDGGHSHSCTASSTSEPHKHATHWRNEGQSGSGKFTLGYQGDSISTKHMDETTVNVSTTCSLDSQTSNMGSVDTGNSNAGHETRPANMKILYIIRVF